MVRSIRGLLLLLLAASLAIIIAARIGSTVWIYRLVPHEAARRAAPALWLNFVVELAVFAGVSLAFVRLLRRDRRDRLEKARLDHLADVAAMSGGFAHEGRNLLHALSARIELLRKHSTGDAKHEERVIKIDELVTEMEHLFTEFLTFARPPEDELEETDVASVVRQVLEFEELELERDEIETVCEFDPSAPPALVDRSKLRRALLNLIVNARHAMPEGGTLRLRVRPQAKQTRVDVQDTGCGIPRDEQRRVFQTYYTTKPDGSGLGLAIVKRTIEDLGGEILLQSTPGAGTTFSMILPGVRQQRARLRRVLQEVAARKAAG